MQTEEFIPFSEMLDAVYDLMGKTPQAKVISPSAKAMFFRAVQHQSLSDVRAALDFHASNATFTPVPKDINDFIESHKPVLWVSGDEAWAQVPKLESDAGILNQITAAVLAVVQPLIDDGDMIAARVAFIKAYDARVALVKADPDPAQRVPVSWVSGGNLPQRFQDPHGERQMLLERGQAAGLLPAPSRPEPVQQISAPAQPGRLKALLGGLQMKSLPPPEAE